MRWLVDSGLGWLLMLIGFTLGLYLGLFLGMGSTV